MVCGVCVYVVVVVGAHSELLTVVFAGSWGVIYGDLPRDSVIMGFKLRFICFELI